MLSLLLFCAFEGVAVFSLFFAAVGHSPLNACVVDFCAGITNSGFSSALNMIAAGYRIPGSPETTSYEYSSLFYPASSREVVTVLS